MPHDDSTRTFKDPFHKPELLLALTTFEALCGFRPVEESLHCLAKLQVPDLKPTIAALARGGLQAAIPQLIALSGKRRAALVSAVAEAAGRFVAAHDPEFINTYRWASSLAETYPGDAGVVISLMCNHLKLSPGEAVFLPAGNLHAYLAGAGVEVMASSDNVLRGGLTAKHVDLAALIEVLDFSDGKVPGAAPGARPGRAALPRAGRGLRPHALPARQPGRDPHHQRPAGRALHRGLGGAGLGRRRGHRWTRGSRCSCRPVRR